MPRSTLLRTFSGRAIAASASALGLFAWSHEARAQQDVQRALPNVLVLLDNSGSMERMIDGSLPEDNAGGANNKCQPGVTTNPNRWGVALQALTGDILPGYSCYQEPRDSTTNPPLPSGAGYTSSIPFIKEYQISGKAPYDASYFLAYHRPLFIGNNVKKYCAYGPNRLPGANSGATGVGPNAGSWTVNGYVVGGGTTGALATDFPTDALFFGGVGSRDAAAVCDASQVQRTNGALDGVPYDTVRFGFMTFDVDVASGTGTTGTSPIVANTPTTPFDGMWSYYPGWDSNGSWSPSGAATGSPAGCTLGTFEVGCRSPAAPPWEGRMIRFPTPAAQTSEIHSVNDNIQNVINALRPYGATPIGGLMQDAETYLWKDPNGPNFPTNNPQYDVFAAQGCRNQYIILLTDGAPNLDLRNGGGGYEDGPGSCKGPPYTCPYKLPEDTALDMSTGAGSNPKVLTYVIGFATSSINDNGNLVQCSNLVQNGALSATCSQNPVPANYQACCTLDKIAFNGGTGSAYFADTPGSLVLALGDIFAKIGQQTTTRTTPAFSPMFSAASYDPLSNTSTLPQSSAFLSAFFPNVGKPWSGDIQRQTTKCDPTGTGTFNAPKVSALTISSGDDFAANVNSHNGNSRNFLAVYPGSAGQTITPGINDSTTTMRPFISGTPKDGVGMYQGSAAFGATPAGPTISNVISTVKGDALGLSSSYSCSNAPSACKSSTPGNCLSLADCQALAWNFLFASQSTSNLRTQPAGQPPLPADANGFMAFQSRYCTTGCNSATPNASALGAIYHATPNVVPPPSNIASDESYRIYASSAPYNTRATVVYAATTDGILHAFDSGVTSQVNNELWAFVPPAVNPNILGTYPASPTVLLDGAPVVSDAVWDRVPSSGSAALTVNAFDWHTMLVAGYGPQARGYYALDVSNPSPTNIPSVAYNVNGGAPAGPVFRWSLTNVGVDASNNAYFDVFGAHSGTPTITTIYADPSDSGATAHEIGVAILPGGWDQAATTGAPAAQGGPGGAACNRAYTQWPGTYGTLPNPLANGAYAFKPRTTVRCWGQKPAGALSTWTPSTTDPVVGRSLSIVRLDTGEIIRTFARLTDFPTTHPLRTSTPVRIKDAPFDSPITGTPLAYPNQVGAIASKIFVSDADGTVWRIDVSDPQPKNWKVSIFLDTVNDAVPGYSSTTAWYQGQPLQVPSTLALDRTGQLVMNVATGDQDTYTAAGTNYVYSVTEKLDSSTQSLRPYINWLAQLTSGERVSGPMTVFDSTLYFATFSPSSGNASCSIGTPHIWGMDFTTAYDTNPAHGGMPMLPSGSGSALSGVNGASSFPAQEVDPNSPGYIIPGVTINQTPACSQAGSPGSDAYVGGASHESIGGVQGSTFSLYFQKGGSSNAGTGLLSNPTNIALPSPRGATVVDSWAAIVE